MDGGTRFSWRYSGQRCMFCSSISWASLTESWYGLKDLFTLQKVNDKFDHDCLNWWRHKRYTEMWIRTGGYVCFCEEQVKPSSEWPPTQTFLGLRQVFLLRNPRSVLIGRPSSERLDGHSTKSEIYRTLADFLKFRKVQRQSFTQVYTIM